MGKSSPPPAPASPDPVALANAQSKSNKATAITQYGLGATNQVTPYGNLTYTQDSKWADGTPHFTATTTLSPEQQKLYDLGTQTQTNLGQLGVDQSAKVSGILNTPFDLNGAINTQQSDIATKLLDPVWQQRENALQTRLANQGISQGSEAYTNALRDFGMQRDNAYNSALLTGRGQAEQEALTQRNQPLNEITALLSGSQVQQPGFTNTPSPGVAPTDVATGYQLQNQNYANQLQAYGLQQQQSNAALGGLFGLGSAALGGWGLGGFKGLSERSTKTDIRKVGKLDDGLNVYSFRYKHGGPMLLGLMADEVEPKYPHAVEHIADGIRVVDYSAVAEAVHG